jgi:hypothetical protein
MSAAPQLYQPSWLDRFQDWVTRRPGPPWLVYLGLALTVALVEVLVKWLDGTYSASIDLLPSHALFAAYGILMLALIHYLDGQAANTNCEC